MSRLQGIAMSLVDSVVAAIPQPGPARDALQHCKIIAHRGEHDNVTVMENTLPAFEAASNSNVWGIECDIRWTADLLPVICHDPTPARVFGIATPVAAMSFRELRNTVPQIPTLEEVLDKFASHTHLMLELKSEPWPQPQRQRDTLRALLESLRPVEDYHLLALEPALFKPLDFLPSACFFPVAETNVGTLSRIAREEGYAGLGGHYLLLTNRVKQRHDALGQQLGTGFPGSKNCLFRELNRGVEWIFSNDAVTLQRIRDHYLASQSFT